MNKFFKTYLPGIYNFTSDFFKAMNNTSDGHSLRKWLCVGLFWVFSRITIEYTNKENLVLVLGVIAGLITSLAITYTVGNNIARKIEQNNEKDNPNGQA